MLAGAVPSAKKRQPAASSSLLILMRAVASLSGIQSPTPAMVVWRHQWPPSGAIIIGPRLADNCRSAYYADSKAALRSIRRHALNDRIAAVSPAPTFIFPVAALPATQRVRPVQTDSAAPRVRRPKSIVLLDRSQNRQYRLRQVGQFVFAGGSALASESVAGRRGLFPTHSRRPHLHSTRPQFPR